AAVVEMQVGVDDGGDVPGNVLGVRRRAQIVDLGPRVDHPGVDQHDPLRVVDRPDEHGQALAVNEELCREVRADHVPTLPAMAGWRGERLSQLRALIRGADPGVIEEVKWKKPSRPEGVPVWSHDGIVCIGEALKNAVRLTFPKGAQLRDPKGLFNTRLDSKTV